MPPPRGVTGTRCREGGAERAEDLGLVAGGDDGLGGDVVELALEDRAVPVEVARAALHLLRLGLGRDVGEVAEQVVDGGQGAGSSGEEVVELGVGRGRGVDRPAAAEHDAAALRPGQHLGPGPALEDDEVGGRAGREAAGRRAGP